MTLNSLICVEVWLRNYPTPGEEVVRRRLGPNSLFTRQLKIKLQTTKLCCLHITAGKWFHKKTVNHEFLRAQL